MKLALAALILLPASAFAAERFTANTLKLSAGEKSPPAQIAEMSWLAGHWKGEAFGGQTEELWAAPVGGTMSGLFRLTKGEKTQFYELMLVTEEKGSLVFKLKHFNADLTGWEEKNEVRSFPLVKKEHDALLFHGMSFRLKGDALTVHLAVEHQGKPTEEVVFHYQRVYESATR